MAGQGSPTRCRAERGYAWQARLAACLVTTLFIFARSIPAAAGAEAESTYEVRLSWGGGPAQVWSGEISVSAGTLRRRATLGMEADAPATCIAAEPTRLVLLPRTPQSYQGVDVQLQAPQDATLSVTLRSAAGGPPHVLRCRVADLLTTAQTLPLDDQGNRLALWRLPRDLLQVVSTSPSSLFRVDETWSCRVIPHAVLAAQGEAVLLSVQVKHLASGEVVWQRQQPLTLDEAGQATDGVAVQLPLQRAGVYELRAELRSRPLLGTLVKAKLWTSRSMQVVALGTPEAPEAQEEWSPLVSFPPGSVQAERGSWLGSWKKLATPALTPFSSAPPQLRTAWGEEFLVLPPGGWQAYPLTIETPGALHMIELHCPSTLPQQLGVRLVEPNGAGQVVPPGMDAGVEIASRFSAASAGATPSFITHRIPCWPNSRAPVLVVSNPGKEPALVGRLQLLSGPKSLPPARPRREELEEGQRWLFACFEQPLFPENFSAPDNADAATRVACDDWQTFLTASERLAEYMHYAGLNAALVPALSGGSTLYRSQWLDPTPRSDSSIFQETGATERTDALELLYRVFTAQQLKLVPSLTFSSPLVELETLKLQGAEEGIDLIGPDGKTWAQAPGTRSGQAPWYNVLDPRVQTAMRHVLQELAEQSHTHASFGGIALTLTADSYARLPDDSWGCDTTTWRRFLAARKLREPSLASDTAAARWQWLERHELAAWQAWRSAELARFYETLRDDLRRVAPTAQLILCPLAPLETARAIAPVTPRLPERDDSLNALQLAGLDAKRLSQTSGITWARVWQTGPAAQISLLPARRLTNGAPQLDALFQQSDRPVAFTFRAPLPLQLESFAQRSPFGAANTEGTFYLQTAPAAAEARRPWITMLAAADAHSLGVGGLQLALGQEEATRPLLNKLAALPAVKFDDLPAPEDRRTQPVLARRYANERESWHYFLNDSPWPVVVDVDFRTSQPVTLHLAGTSAAMILLEPRSGDTAHWRVRLEPYDLAVLQAAEPKLVPKSWQTQVDPAAELALREQLRQVRLRANMVRSPVPLTTLVNAHFDDQAAAGEIPGWTFPRLGSAHLDSARVALDTAQPYNGSASLHVVNQTRSGRPPEALWLRSQAIPVPATGRLALWVWLRNAPGAPQPQLRLAVEGRSEGRTYYRRANVGASEDGSPAQPLRETWSPFLFPLDDLPVAGLTDLRIGFDLMGAGDIWIDGIQLYDLWFQENERDALLKAIAVAEVQLQAGQLRDCARFLESPWPQFLLQHVPAVEQLARTAPATSTPPAEVSPTPAPTLLERVRSWSPRLPLSKKE